MKPTNCLNCGAPLHSTTCEYCGAEYGEKAQSEPLGITLEKDSLRGVLTFMGIEFDVNLISIEQEQPYLDCCQRDIYGRQRVEIAPALPNVTFTLCGTPKRKE